MTVAENACIDDRRFNIYRLEVDTFWRLLRLLPALGRGRHEIWEEIRGWRRDR
jgi:diacylglycerol kinase (ATP)